MSLHTSIDDELKSADRVTLRDGSAVTLRRPVPDDAEALLAYLDKVRRETPNLQFGPDDALPTVEQERAWITGATSGPTSLLILVEADGVPIALAGLHGSVAHARLTHRALLGISVVRAWHGRGLGRLLMERLLAWARANPALDLMVLSVYGGNARAQRLYASLGFVVDGTTPRGVREAHGASAQDVVMMSRWVGPNPLGPPLDLDAGDGLSLRSVRGDDAEVLFALIRANREHLREYFRWPLTVETVGDVTAQIERWNRDEAASGTVTVLLRREDAVIGVVMLHRHQRADQVVELGYWLDKQSQGRGDATRACRRMVSWAFDTLKVNRVELMVSSGNGRSRALARRLGFAEEGVRRRAQVWHDGGVRDLVVYAQVAGGGSAPAFCADLGDGATLRFVEEKDATALFDLYDRNRERFRPWFAWCTSVQSVGEVRDGITQWHARSRCTGSLTCVIEAAGEIRGMAYMVGVEPEHGKVELGYWLDASATGQGLATRACRVLIRHAFEALEANRLDIVADVCNTESQAVAERLGFVREAVSRQWAKVNGVGVDVIRYRLLRETYAEAGL